MKNPHHMAIRPQYHWTDQKIEIHILICIIGYLLTTVAYKKARQVGYIRNTDNFMDDLKSIRLGSIMQTTTKKGEGSINFQLEKVSPELEPLLEPLGITNQNLRPKINSSVYNS